MRPVILVGGKIYPNGNATGYWEALGKFFCVWRIPDMVLTTTYSHAWKFRRTGRLLQAIWINMHEWEKQISDFSATSLQESSGKGVGRQVRKHHLWNDTFSKAWWKFLMDFQGPRLEMLYQIGWWFCCISWNHLSWCWRVRHTSWRRTQMGFPKDVATWWISQTHGVTENKVYDAENVHDSCYILCIRLPQITASNLVMAKDFASKAFQEFHSPVLLFHVSHVTFLDWLQRTKDPHFQEMRTNYTVPFLQNFNMGCAPRVNCCSW